MTKRQDVKRKAYNSVKSILKMKFKAEKVEEITHLLRK